MNINISATPNPDKSVTVNWGATFDKVPRYLTITVFWARKVSTDIKAATGVYGYDSRNTQGQTVELTGSRTVYPPPDRTPTHFIVVANICEYTGTEHDQYECAPTVKTEPVKL